MTPTSGSKGGWYGLLTDIERFRSYLARLSFVRVLKFWKLMPCTARIFKKDRFGATSNCSQSNSGCIKYGSERISVFTLLHSILRLSSYKYDTLIPWHYHRVTYHICAQEVMEMRDGRAWYCHFEQKKSQSLSISILWQWMIAYLLYTVEQWAKTHDVTLCFWWKKIALQTPCHHTPH